jgi:hypothetical protein
MPSLIRTHALWYARLCPAGDRLQERPSAKTDVPSDARPCNYQLLLRTTCKKAALLFRVRVILNKQRP